MDKKDCGLGMRVKINKDLKDFNKGDEFKIINMSIGNPYVLLNEFKCNPEHFEPINKFEIGDTVIHGSRGEKCRYCGINKDGLAILEDENDYLFRVGFEKIKPKKKKGNLEPGDKFKAMDSTFEVVAVGEDSELGTVYFSKSLGMETMYYTIHNEKIDKIIY